MNRWIHRACRALTALLSRRLARHAFWLLLWAALVPAAQAQDMQREIPKAALRGSFLVVQPPVIQIDGLADRLSPGARIRGADNLLVMSGALVGQLFLVNYLRDTTGLVHQVWILTPQEIASQGGVVVPTPLTP